MSDILLDQAHLPIREKNKISQNEVIFEDRIIFKPSEESVNKNFYNVENYYRPPSAEFKRKILEYLEDKKRQIETKCIDSFRAQLVEINEDNVVLKCLMDEEKGIFENRYFDKSPFTGLGNLVTGQFYIVKIYVSPGEKRIVFIKTTEKYSEFYTEPIDYFEDFNDEALFQQVK